MYCPRCRIKMKTARGTHHKKKKWVCPDCGKVKMETLGKRAQDRAKK